MGFGRTGTTTQLGQALNFSATVNLDADETLSRECVSAEVFSGENKLAAGQVRATLEEGANPGERSVRVTTATPIDEPIVTVNVTVGCGAKLSRKFVAFIDPPVIGLAQASAPDAVPAAPQRADSQVAPLLAIVQAANPAASAPQHPVLQTRTERRPSRPVAARPSVAVAANDAVVAGATAAASAPPAAAPKPKAVALVRRAHASSAAASGARLQLDAAAPIVAVAASAPASAAEPPAASAVLAAAAAKVDDASETLIRERQRLAALEEGMTRLRADAAAARQTLVALQAQLQAAESERYANPLVYALVCLSVVLALALIALWRRQARAPATPTWWVPPEAAPSREGAATDPSVAGAALMAAAAQTEAAHASVDPPPAPVVPEPVPPQPANPTPPAPALLAEPEALEPEHELSVEELIDLEQQADFFIVLGQDDAAIDLLMSHVRSSGGTSPLPYLKLLEIYRRSGDTAAYDRIRERFNRRFSAYAPEWDADLQRGKSLEDYPEMAARLQDLWPTPMRVMRALDTALFRRDGGEQTFDLPAYRELLFLYSIARDLSEHPGLVGARLPSSIDLLLPLDSDNDAEMAAQRMMATMPIPYQGARAGEPGEAVTMPLDLDISVPTEAEPASYTPRPAAGDALSLEPDAGEPSNFLGLVDPTGLRLRSGN